MKINRKSQVSAKGNLFLLLALMLVLFAGIAITYADIVTPTYYFHWVDPAASVGLSTTSNRIFNDTTPVGTLREDSFGSNSCSTDDCPHYDFYSPVFDYDTNVTGTQTFYFWSYVSSIAGNKDQISIDFVKLIDFDPDDTSTTIIATNDTDTIMNSISYTEYPYTLSNVDYILPKGHRMIAEVHPYVSTDRGSGDNRNIFYYLGYDTNARNSRVALSYSNVILTTNMTVPSATIYGYDEGTFSLTCNASCDFGQCNDVVIYPQYCTGVGCTDFINMPVSSSNLTTSNASYDAGNISNGVTDGFLFTITEKELGEYIVRCNSTSSNSKANVSDETEYVLVSVVSQTKVEYENKNTYGVLEYETLDNITWINITADAKSANASNVNTTLNIINTTSGIAIWGPDDNKECASFLAKDTTCAVSYDNTSYGYIIPPSETAGTYKFNTTVLWSGTSSENSSVTFKIYNIPANDLNSQIDPTPFKFIRGDNGIYNFSIHNPWSKNLTSVNISINCPQATGVVCNCTLLGQTAQDYCELENITSFATSYAPFNISTTAGTPVANYDVNVTVNYTNPGNQAHTWPEVQNRILEIQSSEDLIVAVFDAPTQVNRNTNQNLYGKVTYLGDINKTNVWLNWSLPAQWSNITGNLTQYEGTLNYSNTSWNNITASISLSAPLGQKRVNLSSNATEGGYDNDYALIDVYADTAFYNLDVANLDQPSKPYDPIRGQTLRIKAKLRYDNNTVVVGKTVEFFDETDSILMGTNITDSLGWVYLYYLVPITSSTGNHTMNVSYGGSSVIYTNPSDTETEINVHDITLLFNISSSPSVVGNGYPVSIRASINDTNQIETALAYINHSVYGEDSYPMTLILGTNESGIWEYNYTAWLYGTYSFYIWANDSFCLYNDTSDDIRYFNVYSNLSIRTITEKKEYGPNEDVLIKAHDWWNASFNYRVPVTVSSTGSENDVLITETVDFTEHLSYVGAQGMSLDNNSIRVIEWNETAGINTEINSSFVDTPPPEIDLWEVSQDAPQPVDFTNGLNSTANTFGPSGSNDGWDWAGSVYGLSSTCVVFNNNDVLNDDLIRITIGDNSCENDGQASGAYGVSFYVSELVYDAISNGGEANLSFDWSVTDFDLDSGDVLWIKSRIGSTTQMYYLGSNLDTGDPFADGNKEVYFASDPVSISNSSSFNVTQYVTSAGWYYLDIGLKIGDWDNGEYASVDFDNITLSVTGSSYDEKSSARLDILWDMNGTTPANTERTYYVYFDIKELENKTYPSYTTPSGGAPSGTITQTQSDTEPMESKVQNIGNMDVKYRTIMSVQRFTGGTWVNVGTPVLDDTTAETDRQTANNSITYLSSLWDIKGWNTITRPAGPYRVKLAMYDASMPPVMMQDQNNADLVATYNFTIVAANVVL
ncbi:MAG: hypothetical protein KAT91_00985, partial [Candidatus Aenigmarchaeota archaeon]|nr:hypothetical protein [Candidatus Aenigmarchaeota archaeon]